MALGSDFAGVSDLTPTMAVSSGFQALAEDLLWLLRSPRGSYPEDLSLGFDLRGAIGSTMPVSIIEQRALEQVTGHEEVDDATCSAAYVGDGKLVVVIRVKAIDGTTGELTLTADQLTIEALLDGQPLEAAA